MPALQHPALPRPGARPIGSPLVWLLLAALGLSVSAVLWSQPASAATAAPRPFRTTYTFDHDVALPDNVVYEEGRLRLGDPVFLAVIDEVDVTVDYLLGSESDTIEVTDGSLQAVVEVVSSAGWERTLDRTDPVPVIDRRAQVVVPVDFAAAQALATAIDAATGISGSLTVRVRADALIDGDLARSDSGAIPLDERTSAAVEFSLGASTAELVVPRRSERDSAFAAIAGIAPGTAAATSNGVAGGEQPFSEVTDPLHPGQRELVRMVPTDVVVPASFALFGRSIDSSLVRTATLALTALFAALAGYGWWAVRRAGRGGAVAAIAAEHHAELVPAARLPAVPFDRIIDLARFDDLLHLSRNLELPLVVCQHGDIVTYAVTDGLTRYRFETLIDAPRHATITSRSVTSRPGRRANDDPATLIVIDAPMIAGHGPEASAPRRRASDLLPRSDADGHRTAADDAQLARLT